MQLGLIAPAAAKDCRRGQEENQNKGKVPHGEPNQLRVVHADLLGTNDQGHAPISHHSRYHYYYYMGSIGGGYAAILTFLQKFLNQLFQE